MQIQIPDHVTVNLKKIAQAIEVDVAKMPTASLEHVFNYGLRQLLNDAMASAGDDKALAEKSGGDRLANLMAGTLRASKEGDPIMAEARKIASAMVDSALADHYGSAKKAREAGESGGHDRGELIRDVLKGDQGDAIRAQAKVNVEGVKTLGKVTIKL